MGLRPEDEKALAIAENKDFGVRCTVPRDQCTWKTKAETQGEIIEQLKDNQAKLNATIESFEKKLGEDMTESGKKELLQSIMKEQAMQVKDTELANMKSELKTLKASADLANKRSEEFEKELSAVMSEEQRNDYIKELTKEIKYKDRLRRNLDTEVQMRKVRLEELSGQVVRQEAFAKELEAKNADLLGTIKAKMQAAAKEEADKEVRMPRPEDSAEYRPRRIKRFFLSMLITSFGALVGGSLVYAFLVVK